MTITDLKVLPVSQPVSKPHDRVGTYINAATAANTRKAYRSDIQHFEQWGGHLPTTTSELARYLEHYATSLSIRTLQRRLTAIKYWHIYQSLPDPTDNPLLSKLLSGIARTHGKPKQKAPAINLTAIYTLHDYLAPQLHTAAKRDLALILIGFFGALRRSELVNIHVEHLRFEQAGLEIFIPTSKTDQEHQGQYCVIPAGNKRLCAIRCLQHWLQHADINDGPVFRRLQAEGQLVDSALSASRVNIILKQRSIEAGIQGGEHFSAHSLRRGLATAAARAGASLPAIMRQGRWKQVSTVMEYIEAAERFTDNAVSSLINNGS